MNGHELSTEAVLCMVKTSGKLLELRTPFRALCIRECIGIPINTWVYVDGIYAVHAFRIGFLVNGSIQPYNHFQISITF